jgi:hypothetical protein
MIISWANKVAIPARAPLQIVCKDDLRRSLSGFSLSSAVFAVAKGADLETVMNIAAENTP